MKKIGRGLFVIVVFGGVIGCDQNPVSIPVARVNVASNSSQQFITHELRVSLDKNSRVNGIIASRIRLSNGRSVARASDVAQGARNQEAQGLFASTVTSKLEGSDKLQPVFYQKVSRRPGTHENSDEVAISFDSGDDELPTWFDPEVDPYPENTFNSVIDAGLSNIAAMSNPVIEESSFLLNDPYSDDLPPEDTFSPMNGMHPAAQFPVRLVQAAFSLDNFLSNDPCVDQKDAVDTNLFFTGVVIVGAMVAIAAIGPTVAAAAVVSVMSGATTSVVGAVSFLGLANRSLERCKSNNPSYYPRRR